MSTPAHRAEPTMSRHRLTLGLAAAACLAAVIVNGNGVVHPLLINDDFQIFAASWTWGRAWQNVWVPANEHAMPLGRLTTAALVAVLPDQTWLPRAGASQGAAAAVAGMVLVYFFVSRERGGPAYGLAAMALFGVTSVYQQAVTWFSA